MFTGLRNHHSSTFIDTDASMQDEYAYRTKGVLDRPLTTRLGRLSASPPTESLSMSSMFQRRRTDVSFFPLWLNKASRDWDNGLVQIFVPSASCKGQRHGKLGPMTVVRNELISSQRCSDVDEEIPSCPQIKFKPAVRILIARFTFTPEFHYHH